MASDTSSSVVLKYFLLQDICNSNSQDLETKLDHANGEFKTFLETDVVL